MEEKELFAMGIGIKAPWYIKNVELIGEGLKKELHIYLDHKRGANFEYEGIKIFGLLKQLFE